MLLLPNQGDGVNDVPDIPIWQLIVHLRHAAPTIIDLPEVAGRSRITRLKQHWDIGPYIASGQSTSLPVVVVTGNAVVAVEGEPSASVQFSELDRLRYRCKQQKWNQ